MMPNLASIFLSEPSTTLGWFASYFDLKLTIGIVLSVVGSAFTLIYLLGKKIEKVDNSDKVINSLEKARKEDNERLEKTRKEDNERLEKTRKADNERLEKALKEETQRLEKSMKEQFETVKEELGTTRKRLHRIDSRLGTLEKAAERIDIHLQMLEKYTKQSDEYLEKLRKENNDYLEKLNRENRDHLEKSIKEQLVGSKGIAEEQLNSIKARIETLQVWLEKESRNKVSNEIYLLFKENIERQLNTLQKDFGKIQQKITAMQQNPKP